MRRRKVKGADEKLLSYKDYVVRDNIESLKGGDSFQVSVDAKERKGKKSCNFNKIGIVRNDTLFILANKTNQSIIKQPDIYYILFCKMLLSPVSF